MAVVNNLELGSPEFWLKRWDDKDIGFHLSTEHPTLVKYLSELKVTGSKQSIFLPLCGKSNDLIFLARQGFSVYGCELSNAAVETFFLDNSLEFSTSSPSQKDPSVQLHVCSTLDITIFCGDLYHLKSGTMGPSVGFDCVFDRGSFEAIPKPDRSRYAIHMASLVKSPDCRYLLCALELVGGDYAGPPFSPKLEDVQVCFGDSFSINHLEHVEDHKDNHRASWNCDQIYKNAFILLSK